LVLLLPLAARAGDNEPPPGFVALFNGRDLSGWRLPEGDGGHWKVVDDVIDYDAESQARSDRSRWLERELSDFVLMIDWRLNSPPKIRDGQRFPNATLRILEIIRFWNLESGFWNSGIRHSRSRAQQEAKFQPNEQPISRSPRGLLS
jgi:hypothetical protein